MAVHGEDGVVLGRSAWTTAYVLRDMAYAREQAEKAPRLNPNAASTWANSGWINLWSGDPEKAPEDFARSMRLNSIGAVPVLRNGFAYAYFFLGRYDDATTWAGYQLRDNPEAHPVLRIATASAAAAGPLDRVRNLAARLSAIDPAFRVGRLQDYLGPYRDDLLDTLKRALRTAGLPE